MADSHGSGMLSLYNTLTRDKEPFVPIDPDRVGIYVCGPTVYDYAHIGNARPVIVFDVLVRLLRFVYGADHVTYVRNITDVDDKINARAAEEHPGEDLNQAIARVTEVTGAQFHKDMKALGNLPPDIEPRATDHIAQMITMITALIENGNAYEAEGHVLFNVESWRDETGQSLYGQLSRRSVEDMIAGARVDVAPYKAGPMDFVLWKPSSATEPGWESPWGRGRPGWHIECSAMAKQHLGETFDIHGGGIDLVFPHHENEIAQSRCADHTARMANIWMHNGFLQVNGDKMSKSLGNFFTVHELLDSERFGGRAWPGAVLRLAMLMTHYRKPIDFTEERLIEAEKILTRWVEIRQHAAGADWDAAGTADEAFGPDRTVGADGAERTDSGGSATGGDGSKVDHGAGAAPGGADNDGAAGARPDPGNAAGEGNGSEDDGPVGARAGSGGAAGARPDPQVLDFLFDDLNTPAAIARLQGLAREAERGSQAAVSGLVGGLGLIGFDLEALATEADRKAAAVTADPEIQALVDARAAARAAKDFAEADRLRDVLTERGVQLSDARNPETGAIETSWSVRP